MLCAIDIFSKYAWVVPLRGKRGISIVNAFQKIISELRKPNKLWIDDGVEFSKINSIEMYSTYNKGKHVVTERFIRTLKSKTFKHMTIVLKNFYFDVLDDIVNKYNNSS